MTNTVKQVTKEWYRCKPFEKVLQTLWKENPTMKFTRQDLLERINRGDFGDNLVATNTPDEGSVEEILEDYRKKGKEWLDIQDLTYHYSHHNPTGNYHSQTQMLKHVTGMGDDTVFSLHQDAFEEN